MASGSYPATTVDAREKREHSLQMDKTIIIGINSGLHPLTAKMKGAVTAIKSSKLQWEPA